MVEEVIMDRYTIYCDIEQTKKALELDAPIIVISESYQENRPHFHMCINNENATVVLPTAEQMIGWLENHLSIHVEKCTLDHWSSGVETKDHYYDHSEFKSRKVATLAAIDKALELLKEIKKKDE